jgi:hypothetical protein
MNANDQGEHVEEIFMGNKRGQFEKRFPFASQRKMTYQIRIEHGEDKREKDTPTCWREDQENISQ